VRPKRLFARELLLYARGWKKTVRQYNHNGRTYSFKMRQITLFDVLIDDMRVKICDLHAHIGNNSAQNHRLGAAVKRESRLIKTAKRKTANITDEHE
jgi:hypothetical protein